MNYKDKDTYHSDDLFNDKYQYDPLYIEHFFAIFILYFSLLLISIILFTIEILLNKI